MLPRVDLRFGEKGQAQDEKEQKSGFFREQSDEISNV
jgi:hypothetical protein